MNAIKFVEKFSLKIANLVKIQNHYPSTQSNRQIQKQSNDQQPQQITINEQQYDNIINQPQNDFQEQRNQNYVPNEQTNKKNKNNFVQEVDLISPDEQKNSQIEQEQKKVQRKQQKIHQEQFLSQIYQEPNVFQNPGNISIDDQTDYYNKSVDIQYQNIQNQNNHITNNDADNDLLHLIKMKIQKDGKSYGEIHNVPTSVSSDRGQYDKHFNQPYRSMPQNMPAQRNGQGNLSDGRHFNASYKRQFSKNLFKALKNQTPDRVNQTIKNAAHGIQVHVYEVKNWLTAYRLIFNIQKFIQNRGTSLSQSQKMSLIKREVLNYLIKNKNQKKYRIIRILNCIFQSFNFGEIKTQAWLNQFLAEFAKDLRNIDIVAQQNKANKSKSSDENSSDFQDKDKKANKILNNKKSDKMDKKASFAKNQQDDRQVMQSLAYKKKIKPQNKSNQVMGLNLNKKQPKSIQFMNGINDPFKQPQPQSIAAYYPLFKKKICEKINEQLHQAIDQIFKVTSEQFCLSYNTLKCIYQENGQYKLGYKSGNSQKNNQFALKPVIGKPQKVNSISQQTFIPQVNQKKLSNQRPIPNLNQPKIPNQRLQNNQSVADNNSKTALFAKLQNRLLMFLKNNINCLINQLEKQTDTTMEALKFSEKWKEEVRNQWFCVFLRKNKLSVSSDRRVMRASTQPLPNQSNPQTRHPSQTQPPIRPPPGSVQMNPNLINGRLINGRPINGKPQPQKNYVNSL